MLMSLIYEGHFYAFPPVTKLERTGLTVIRPLLYMTEPDIIGFARKQNLPVAKSPCPANGHTRREYTKNLMHQINRENPGAIDKMFTAIPTGRSQCRIRTITIRNREHSIHHLPDAYTAVRFPTESIKSIKIKSG